MILIPECLLEMKENWHSRCKREVQSTSKTRTLQRSALSEGHRSPNEGKVLSTMKGEMHHSTGS